MKISALIRELDSMETTITRAVKTLRALIDDDPEDGVCLAKTEEATISDIGNTASMLSWMLENK